MENSKTISNIGIADEIGATQPDMAGSDFDEAEILERARTVGMRYLEPNAISSDKGSEPNSENFRALAEFGLLGLTLPRAWGGLGGNSETQRRCSRILASYCGVTTFVQAQHHSPSRMIANCENDALKQRLLPDLASGTKLCAISFAHLRRPGLPVMRAEPSAKGLRLNGVAPWVTGWGLMRQVVVGATLPDGRFVYIWTPASRLDYPELFEGKDMPDAAGSLTPSTPIALCAMNSSATVELRFEDWYVPEEHRLQETDRETMQRNDRAGVLSATAMPLGCAEASIRLLCQTADRRNIPSVRRAFEAFQNEWNDLYERIEAQTLRTQEPNFFEEAVTLRAWCIEMAVRAAHAAITANSGAANLITHPAQRLLREAMFYTIQAQTQEVMDATLSRLENRARS